MKISHLLIPFLISLVAGLSVGPACASDVTVAVATNFSTPMEKIAAKFEAASGHKLRLSYGASGKFYTQIKQGAPFDVFLSADAQTPERLAQEGDAVAASQFTYAIGKLVLWSPQAGYIDAKGAVLSNGSFKHLALGNPNLAPYGRAAQQAMEHAGVWMALQERLVRGENIAQAHQFVLSGNAELGFVALSQIQHDGNIAGSYWLVPDQWYAPIIQQAVLLKHGKDMAAAHELLQFLKSPAALAIIQASGYGLPH
jgi:molybdate transport system substrate-binding protein